MKITITLPDELIEETRKITGLKSISDVASLGLREFLKSRKRLELLNHIFEYPTPHSFKKIKKDRRR